MHAILPRWALNGGPGKCLAEPELLSPFVRASLHLSPSGVDEDGFLLRLAQDRDALLLSNDLYRDHIESGLVSREWVAARAWAASQAIRSSTRGSPRRSSWRVGDSDMSVSTERDGASIDAPSCTSSSRRDVD